MGLVFFFFLSTLFKCTIGETSEVIGEATKVLSEVQFNEMLQELRNQNQAIFKQTAHSRILSSKVSELTKSMETLKKDNAKIKQAMRLSELKMQKKIKRMKLKQIDDDIRMGEILYYYYFIAKEVCTQFENLVLLVIWK